MLLAAVAIAGPCSVWGPQGSQGPFLQSSFPAWAGAWGSSFWEEFVMQLNVIRIVAASFEKIRNDDLGINNLCYCSWKKGYLNTSRLREVDWNKQKGQEKGSSDPHVNEYLIIERELLNDSLRAWASAYLSLWELLYGLGGTKWSQNVLWRKEEYLHNVFFLSC